MKRYLLLTLLLCSVVSLAQKKALTHDDYDLWKRAGATNISNNGKVVTIAVTTTTGAGDGYLQIHNLESGRKDTFFNGERAVISPDEKYVYFLQKPAYEKLRQEKKDEVKKDKQSKSTFMVYDIASGSIIDSVQRVKSFYASDKVSGYVIIEHFKDLKPEKKKIEETPKEKKKRFKNEKRRSARKTKARRKNQNS